jgi:hypothetical protein
VPIEPNTTATTTANATPSTGTTNAAAGTLPASAIENELPTYRAISATAVVSLLCGIVSILSFASWGFLIFSAAAIAIGLLADRKIVRYSDVLTGRGIAQAGIAIGLSFGLASITMTMVQSWLRVRAAEGFARQYEDVLNKGLLEDIVWYGQAPHVRKDRTPKGLLEEMKKSSPGGGMMDMELASITQLKSRLGDGKAEVHFEKIEQHGKDGLDSFAAALYEIHPKGSTKIPEGEQYALAVLRGRPTESSLEWFVENLNYPYKPASYKVAPKPADDGHGHAH